MVLEVVGGDVVFAGDSWYGVRGCVAGAGFTVDALLFELPCRELAWWVMGSGWSRHTVSRLLSVLDVYYARVWPGISNIVEVNVILKAWIDGDDVPPSLL
ncbi:hypothetical protein Tco_1193316 [Tanacetum coccineum]